MYVIVVLDRDLHASRIHSFFFQEVYEFCILFIVIDWDE
jgi:hypothetical protein